MADRPPSRGSLFFFGPFGLWGAVVGVGIAVAFYVALHTMVGKVTNDALRCSQPTAAASATPDPACFTMPTSSPWPTFGTFVMPEPYTLPPDLR